MDVTVVIPLFNKAPHVEAAVRSALGQTLSPREVLVIDDGSTDGGLDVVRAIDDPRLTVLTRSRPGPGGYAARNHGIRHARGEWVAFLDADDLWLPHHLADMAEAVAACAEPAGGVFTRFEVKEAGRDRLYPVAEDILAPGRAMDLSTIVRAWLATGRCPIWTSACAFRKDVLVEAGLFPEGRARRGGDKDMWLRAAARARTAYAPRVSAEFHQNTVNRVTTSTGHTDLPVIARTVRALVPSATPEEGRLLRALSNQEVALYARYATGARMKIDGTFLKSIYLPQGLREATTVLMLQAARPLIGAWLDRWRPRMSG